LPVSVSLTKIKKKTKQSKGELIQEIRDYAAKYHSIYVLSLENLRSHLFLQVSHKSFSTLSNAG
jgi:hypothetical protein